MRMFERKYELLRCLARSGWIQDYSPIERSHLQEMAGDGLVTLDKDHYAITELGKVVLANEVTH
jgi:hypothetical protein